MDGIQKGLKETTCAKSRKSSNDWREIISTAFPRQARNFSDGHVTMRRITVYYVGGNLESHLVPVMIMASQS